MGQQARPAVTPLGIAVLALLEERPMHPYEMFQLLIARREDVLVKVRPGSLYHTVARLAEQQMVQADGVDRDGNRPERTTYRITEGGRTALRARIAEIVRYPAPEYPMFPVALAELHNLPLAEVIALLRERVGHLEADRADVATMITWADERRVPRRYVVTLPYLHAMLDAEIAWVNGFLDELAGGAMPWETFDAHTGTRETDHHHVWSSGTEAAAPAARRGAIGSAPPP